MPKNTRHGRKKNPARDTIVAIGGNPGNVLDDPPRWQWNGWCASKSRSTRCCGCWCPVSPSVTSQHLCAWREPQRLRHNCGAKSWRESALRELLRFPEKSCLTKPYHVGFFRGSFWNRPRASSWAIGGEAPPAPPVGGTARTTLLHLLQLHLMHGMHNLELDENRDVLLMGSWRTSSSLVASLFNQVSAWFTSPPAQSAASSARLWSINPYIYLKKLAPTTFAGNRFWRTIFFFLIFPT